MSYIDYNMAGLEDREVFSATKTETAEIYEKLKVHEEILGAVLIATCNRTELYLSLVEGSQVNPFDQLCLAIGIDPAGYEQMNRTLYGDDAIRHLCRVASGAESQIWGEEQIISQVRNSIKMARELKASDTILNVVFRTGVSAGKKVKTLVKFQIHDNSTAARAVSVMKRREGVKDILVIGNGMIGRLVAELLVRAGKNVTMTLRQYKYTENVVPNGVKTVNYGDRYSVIEKSDGVISATTSPHYTVSYEEASKLKSLPSIFIDLAVPRDIDPETAKMEGIEYYNVDDISAEDTVERKEEQLEKIDRIIDKYMDDFYKWYDYRESLKLKSS